MKHCDTLILPRWVVPVRPAGAVLTDHAVALSEGRIAAILPAAEARETFQPSVTVERPEHVLIPGLVNAHTHAAMTLIRGLADDLPLEQWLSDAVFPTEKRWVSAEMVRDGTELAIAEMLEAGVTCFSDQYFFPEIVAETAIEAQMRANVGTPIIDFPTAWARDASEYISKGADLVHDPYSEHPLITTCFTPHQVAALSDEGFRELRIIADQLDIPIQIHLHETQAEIDLALRNTGMRPFERLQQLGLVNSSLLVVHAVHMSDDELAHLADQRVAIAHCPKSNLKLASGIAPLTSWLSAGIRVGIGTDGAASNNMLDVLDEVRTAALLAKAQSGNAAAIPASEALELATLGGANALGLGDEIGTIEPGKAADLACVDLEPLHSQPVYDPVSQLVYTARKEQVRDTWVNGRHLLEAGQLTHMNSDDVRARANEWQARIAQGRDNMHG